MELRMIYFICMNIIGFMMMGLDKFKAKHRKWRISEKTLFLIAIIGGSVGVMLGMGSFHHKTKHFRFLIGIPIIICVQIIFGFICMSKFG